jgi:DNA-directed RNA polymerase specialized sigma24 family protein
VYKRQSLARLEASRQLFGDPEKALMRAEGIKIAVDRIKNLGEPFETIFTMYFLEGRNSKEIANRLNIHRSSVFHRLHKIRNVLAGEIEKDISKEES